MRGVVKFLLTLIAGLALIWLGFWWYAESRLQSGFRDWADTQAADGWKISYDSVRRGTSLLDAAITIDNLVLGPPTGPGGQPASIALAAVTLRIDALNPLVFHTDLPAKIAITIGSNIDLVVSTGSIALAEDLNPNTLFNRADPFRGGDFAASDIDFLASAGSLLVLHIDHIGAHSDLNLNAKAGSTALFSRVAFDGVAVSPLLARFASIPFDGKLAHLDAFINVTGPVPANLPDLADRLSSKANDFRARQALIMPAVHQWAAQGGAAKAGLNLVLGPTTLNAAASVAFDANLQPGGAADLTADHLDLFTAALLNAYPALQNEVAQAEAQYSPYIGNTPQGGQTLSLRLTYGTPGIIINGQKTADMPALDWNAAENPPPAPAQAPGDGSGAASSGAASSGAATP